MESVILDGEAVMVGPDGISDFFALHKALANQHAPEAILYAFDILHADGEDYGLGCLPNAGPSSRSCWSAPALPSTSQST